MGMPADIVEHVQAVRGGMLQSQHMQDAAN